jgi:hypothetical protein
MSANTIKRIYIRRYRDNGQTMAYCDWADGSRTEATAQHYYEHPSYKFAPRFGVHMHQLFARAKREGLKLQRETW